MSEIAPKVDWGWSALTEVAGLKKAIELLSLRNVDLANRVTLLETSLADLEDLHRSLEAMVYSMLKKQDTINQEILKKLEGHE